MIYLIMCGRLGNQLFQYAFARKGQQETGQDLAIDFTAIDQVGNAEWRNYLEDYQVSTYKIVKKMITFQFKDFCIRSSELFVLRMVYRNNISSMSLLQSGFISVEYCFMNPITCATNMISPKSKQKIYLLEDGLNLKNTSKAWGKFYVKNFYPKIRALM